MTDERVEHRCLACEWETVLQLWRGTYKDHSCDLAFPPGKTTSDE